MTTTCPQCGKQMSVSLEELSLRDGQVVCPQCLTTYAAADAATLIPAARRGNAGDANAQRFCHHCGESITPGINFCPYCGVALHGSAPAEPENTPSANTEELAHGTKPDNNERRKRTTSQRTTHKSSHRHSSRQSSQSRGHDTDNENGFDWKPMIPSYRLAQIRQRQPASPAFRAFALVIIAALLALLAFIVYQALKLAI